MSLFIFILSLKKNPLAAGADNGFCFLPECFFRPLSTPFLAAGKQYYEDDDKDKKVVNGDDFLHFK